MVQGAIDDNTYNVCGSVRQQWSGSAKAEDIGRCRLTCFFFFSSRRRHTRFDCDWSSDVCSSDLVAAVRFRNTLKDTKDAVYIFLALAVGVAAGVFAPTVAAVMSVVFNAVVLTLWQFNVGNIYADRLGGDRAARLEPHLAAADDKKKRFNGALLIHAARLEPARRVAEALLDERAKRWKLAEVVPTDGGTSTLEYLVRLKDEAVVATLVDTLKAQGAPDIVAAEFRSLRGLKREGKD